MEAWHKDYVLNHINLIFNSDTWRWSDTYGTYRFWWSSTNTIATSWVSELVSLTRFLFIFHSLSICKCACKNQIEWNAIETWSSLKIGLLQMYFFSFSSSLSPSLSLFSFIRLVTIWLLYKVIGFLPWSVGSVKRGHRRWQMMYWKLESGRLFFFFWQTKKHSVWDVRSITIHLIICIQYLYRINVIDSMRSFNNGKQTKTKIKIKF